MTNSSHVERRMLKNQVLYDFIITRHFCKTFVQTMQKGEKEKAITDAFDSRYHRLETVERCPVQLKQYKARPFTQ